MIFLTSKSYTHTFSNSGELQLNIAEHLPEIEESPIGSVGPELEKVTRPNPQGLSSIKVTDLAELVNEKNKKILPKLVENAVLTNAEKPTYGSEDTDKVYRFLAAVKGEEVKPVKLTVKEYSVKGQNLP